MIAYQRQLEQPPCRSRYDKKPARRGGWGRIAAHDFAWETTHPTSAPSDTATTFMLFEFRTAKLKKLRSVTKQMFKNLLRPRLFDFFTLTAAVAVAITVGQVGGWRDHEKPWLIGGLITAALVVWCATRLGKTSPTPGLFLAAFAGAIYGLVDVSPWVILLGMDRIEFFLTSPSPEYSAQLDEPHLEKYLNPLLLLLLMGVPAILFGAAWKTVWLVIQWSGGKLPAAKAKFEKLALTLPVVGTILLIGLCLYFPLRPQIRYVRTIRIPFEYLPPSNPSPTSDKIAMIPSISAWTITPEGQTLYALREDRQLFEVETRTNTITRRITLQCGELSKTRELEVRNDGRLSEPIPFANISEGRALDHFEQIHLLDANTLLLLRYYGDAANCMTAFDLRTGAPAEIPRPEFGADEKVYSLSQNGHFLITYVDNEADIENTNLTLWNLKTATKLEQFTISRSELLDHKFAISETGAHRRLIEDLRDGYVPDGPQFKLQRANPEKPKPRPLRPRIGYDATHLLSDRPQISDDGQWIVDERGCYNVNQPYELVDIEFGDRSLSPTLDKQRNRLIFLPPDWRHDSIFAAGPHFLFGASRLDRCYPNQLVLFDLKTKSKSTAIFRQGLLNRPNIASAKFYDDGRFLIIADEDKTADLFHVFSMP